MLRIHAHKDAKRAAAYYSEHLATGSATLGYYSQGEEIAGAWFGKGAELLKLSGAVTDTALGLICDNRRPDDGKPLTQRRKQNANAAYDCVLSAPKSISVMALVFDDKRVVKAHEQAVTETLAEIERLAMVRVRADKANSNRFSGNVVGARFTHFTARGTSNDAGGDPQIHDHCLTFNASFDPVEDCWKALQPAEIYRRSRLMTAFYRNRLAAGLLAIGYNITTDAKRGLEIDGVSREVIEIFSKRHKQIDTLAAACAQANNPGLRAAIAQTSRQAKDSSLTVEQLRPGWLAQLSPEQLAQLSAVKAGATAPIPVVKMKPDEAIQAAADHLYERRAVVQKHEIYEEALVAARGKVELPELEAALHADPDKYIIEDEDVTTPAAVAAEQALIDYVNAGKGKFAPLSPGYSADAELKGELAVVVETLLSSPDSVVALHGPAGAGKTTTLKAVRNGLHFNGHDVIVCAPYAAQVDKLRKDGFVTAQTLERLLTDKTWQKEISGSVLVVDEAGLIAARQMNELFQLAEEHGCRVILVGDTKQFKPIEASDALLLLEKKSELTCASLSKIWRQTHEIYEQSIVHLKNGKTAEGFKVLDELGWVRELSDDERYHKIGEEYSDALLHKTDKDKCLVVCSTWEECARVTELVRWYLQGNRPVSAKQVPFPFAGPEPQAALGKRFLRWTPEFRPGVNG